MLHYFVIWSNFAPVYAKSFFCPKLQVHNFLPLISQIYISSYNTDHKHLLLKSLATSPQISEFISKNTATLNKTRDYF